MHKKIAIFNSVFTIYVFSVVNFILSILLQLYLAYFFGTTRQMDAYLVAMNIPIIITSLMLSFEAVLVPMFKSSSLHVQESQQVSLISTIFNLLVLILFALIVICVLFSSKIILILASGFSMQDKKLTESLFRIMVPSVLFSGLAAFLTSVYHYKERFALASLAPVANILGIIAFTFLLRPFIGIHGLAYGALIGSIIQFTILFLPLLFYRQYFFVLETRQNELIRIGKKILCLSLGGGFLGSILILEKYLASSLPEGSISFLGYAGRMTSIVILFPSYAIPTVLLPQLSAFYTLKDKDQLKNLLSKGISMTLLCVLPITFLLIIFRVPIIKILFQRGAFDLTAVYNTSAALFCYLGVLIALGMSKVVTAGFLAIHNVIVPSLLMVGDFLLYALIAPVLVRFYSFQGLAAAFSFVCIVSLVVEVFILKYRLNGINGKSLLRSLIKIFLSSLIMGIVSLYIFRNTQGFFSVQEKLDLFIRMGIAVILGCLVFNSVGFLLHIEELPAVYEIAYSRLKEIRKSLKREI